MAIWQHNMLLVSEGTDLPRFSDGEWDLPQLPAASTLNAQANLIGQMGYPWLMMDDWIVFGDESATRVDFHYDESDTAEILIRLDVSASESQLNALCSFAAELNCRLFDPANETILAPDSSALAKALASSSAAAFVRSPRNFLAGRA